ncbi:ATP-binding protein [Pelosinus baikalensis]|uniref:ATP-binding protein n=1 Tax=Pelosinus baikalensis TaxID=2892015 RepID=A0ABS8I128_9FIRM|nr:ATP-binding protein [Pelosinus baikalensis]MCC5468159.1 ATP-binding protein [Pelosinus baikalensis]
MNQLLLILVDNAIKYTPAGGRVGVLLTMTAAPKPCITIVVHDSGVGIQETELSAR